MEISWNFVSPEKWEPCKMFSYDEYLLFSLFILCKLDPTRGPVNRTSYFKHFHFTRLLACTKL